MNFYCRAQSVGIGQFVRCLEDANRKCSYAVPIGSANFCYSPLRPDIAKKPCRKGQQKQMKEPMGKDYHYQDGQDINGRVLPLIYSGSE